MIVVVEVSMDWTWLLFWLVVSFRFFFGCLVLGSGLMMVSGKNECCCRSGYGLDMAFKSFDIFVNLNLFFSLCFNLGHVTFFFVNMEIFYT